jgi:hypothetical protein
MILTRLLTALFVLIPTLCFAQVEEDWKLSQLESGLGWKATNTYGAFEVALEYRDGYGSQWSLILEHPEPIGVDPNAIPGAPGIATTGPNGYDYIRYPSWFTTLLIDKDMVHLANPDAIVAFDGITFHDESENTFLRLWREVCDMNCIHPSALEDLTRVHIPLRLAQVKSLKHAKFARIWYTKAKNVQGLSDTEFRYQFPLYNYDGVNTDAIDTLIRIATEPGFDPELDGASDTEPDQQPAARAQDLPITSDLQLPAGYLALCARAAGVVVLQNLLDQAVADDAAASYLSIIAKGAAAEGCSILTTHAPIAVIVTDEHPNELRVNAAILDGWISRRLVMSASQ